MDSVASIRAKLDADTQSRLETIECFDVIESTNSYLLDAGAPAAGHARLAIADHQTGGRGRHGRIWHSEPGGSLCLSLSWSFERMPESLPALTLVAGVAVGRALDGLGIAGIELKWPNDIVASNAKLGGLLAETVTASSGRIIVVIGIGMNMAIDDALLDRSASSWAERAIDLRSYAPDPVDRDTLAAALCTEFVAALLDFEHGGLNTLLDEWRSRDWLRGAEIKVASEAEEITGVADGIDDDGALRLLTADGPKRILSGSISRSERA